MACIIFTLEDGSTLKTTLDVDLITIGRAPDSIVQLTCGSVSSHHAVVKAREDGYYVQDLGSRNGTRLNGAVIEEAKLNDGDRVAFGDIESVFWATDEAPVPVAVEAPAPVVMVAPEVVQPLVQAAPPATGVPPGKGYYNPNARFANRKVQSEGSGCMTFIGLMILFLGAFVVGLCLRHYKETDGGVLPNDLIQHFTKGIRISVDESAK